jgi:hypothetical protein
MNIMNGTAKKVFARAVAGGIASAVFVLAGVAPAASAAGWGSPGGTGGSWGSRPSPEPKLTPAEVAKEIARQTEAAKRDYPKPIIRKPNCRFDCIISYH